MNDNLEVARAKQKKYYDKRVSEVAVYNVGDWVLVVNERNKVGESKAFKDRALGPFKVVVVETDQGVEFEQVEVSQLDGEEGLVLGTDSEEEMGAVGAHVVAQVTVEPAAEVVEVVAEAGLVQCRWMVERVRCTKMCKPAGMGTHVAVHRKAGLVEPEGLMRWQI